MFPPSRPISPSARKLSMKNRLFVVSRYAKTNKENCPFWQQKISPLPHVYTDCLRGSVIKTQSVSSRRPTLFWWFYDVIFLRPSPAMVAWSAPWDWWQDQKVTKTIEQAWVKSLHEKRRSKIQCTIVPEYCWLLPPGFSGRHGRGWGMLSYADSHILGMPPY